jgi:hypothetical protein
VGLERDAHPLNAQSVDEHDDLMAGQAEVVAQLISFAGFVEATGQPPPHLLRFFVVERPRTLL